jgi:pimeloyl-ACP methyl ester carboxylesterase
MTAMPKPRLHHEVHGDRGPFLLLVHGMLSSRAQWMLNIEALCEFVSCRSRAVGHGRSPTPDEPEAHSPERYMAEFEAIRRSLDAERWLICGQSSAPR